MRPTESSTVSRAPTSELAGPSSNQANSATLPLSSQHTTTFSELLRELGISIAVTTYQAGKLVLLREINGTINTHFRSFNKPMGLAVENGRMAIGTSLEIWEFHNAPAVASRIATRKHDVLNTQTMETDNSAGVHPTENVAATALPVDACYLPRGSHTTGDIQIHEMSWRDSELWFVNTRFSCLCTRDIRYNFVPQWKPPFVSSLAPEDRCHLNGMCVMPSSEQTQFNETHSNSDRKGPSFYVTALGETDVAGGWRSNKRNGGLLVETRNNNVLVRGLSMPHSPRWYRDRLWALESGAGTIGRVDVNAGRYEPIATLPGFTRGLDFYGRYAFIGLSQVRESAHFSGIAIAERPVSDRWCGVAVVDIDRGEPVAWLKFDEGVQEIFAVHVLRNSRYPDLINDDPALIADSFVLPNEALAVVPESIRFVHELSSDRSLS